MLVVNRKIKIINKQSIVEHFVRIKMTSKINILKN
jgi:hypothetical protein